MLTLEQQAIIDAVLENQDKIITVNAVAGSGKSSTAKAICEAYKPTKGFYTAFNKGIVTDSAKKLNHLIDAKTVHALAYKYIKPTKQIQELSFNDIDEDLYYSDKLQIIQHIDKFYRSAYLYIEDYLTQANYIKNLHPYIFKYIELMQTGKIKYTFNYLLKCLHVLLANNELDINFDLFILDECQDTNPVILEIFKLINCPTKIMLGDTYQNIYDFLDTVNGFELITDSLDFKLTKSFRCNEEVAAQIQKFGDLYLDDKFKFEGNPELNNLKTKDIAFLTRTNTQLITIMADLVQARKSFSLIKDINTIFALPLALIMASKGKPVFDHKYKYFEKEYKIWKTNHSDISFHTHLQNLGVEEVISAVHMLNFLNKNNIDIFKLKEQVKNQKPNKDIILSTAHSFKGLERSMVYINKQLKESISTNNQQDLNLYYVALSRAKGKIIYESL